LSDPENPITIGSKSYKFEDLTPESQTLVQHMVSLDGKLNNLKFEMDQLQFGRNAVYTRLLNAVTGEDDHAQEKQPIAPRGGRLQKEESG